MRSPFGCVLVDFLGQRLPRSWGKLSHYLISTSHPAWPCRAARVARATHGNTAVCASTAIHAATLPCPAVQTQGLAGDSPGGQGEGRTFASSCWHGCQNIFTGQVILTPGSLGTLISIKPKNTTTPRNPQSSVEGMDVQGWMPGWGCQSQFPLACLAPASKDPAVPIQRDSQVTAHSEQPDRFRRCLHEWARYGCNMRLSGAPENGR